MRSFTTNRALDVLRPGEAVEICAQARTFNPTTYALISGPTLIAGWTMIDSLVGDRTRWLLVWWLGWTLLVWICLEAFNRNRLIIATETRIIVVETGNWPFAGPRGIICEHPIADIEIKSGPLSSSTIFSRSGSQKERLFVNSRKGRRIERFRNQCGSDRL